MADLLDAANFDQRLSKAVQLLLKHRSNTCEDYSNREEEIYELNCDINAFLEASREDTKSVVRQHHELGLVLTLLSRDERQRVSARSCTLLVKNISWFYRPNDNDPLAVRATQWSQNLLRSFVTYPLESIRKACPALPWSRGLHLPLGRLLEIVKPIFKEHIVANELGPGFYDSIAETGLLLLLNEEELDSQLLAAVMKYLPSSSQESCPDNVKVFYAFLSKRLARDSSYMCGLHHQLSQKFAIHLENELIRLLKNYTNGQCQLNSWLVVSIRKDRTLFRIALHMLNTISSTMDSHPVVQEFVQHLKKRVEKDAHLFGMYPGRLAPLVYLLEVHPVESEEMNKGHAIHMMRKLTAVMIDGTLNRNEILQLRCQFPEWFQRIWHLDAEQDQQVKMELSLFHHLCTSD